MKRKLVTSIIILIVIFIALSLFGSFYIFNRFTNLVPRNLTLQRKSGYEQELNINYNNILEKYNGEKIFIASSLDSHKIPAIYLKNPKNKNTVVMAHALGRTKETSLMAGQIFMELGYNVIAIDQRNSGENLAPYNTFGYLESYDLIDTVNFAKSQSPNGKIALWGESHGGHSSAIGAGRDSNNIDYLILDCPSSNGKDFLIPIFKNIESKTKIPSNYMVFLTNLSLKAKLGYNLKDTDAREWIKNSNVPTLVFSTKKDKIVQPTMPKDLYDAVKNPNKKFVESNSSQHVYLYVNERDMYKKELSKFLYEK